MPLLALLMLLHPAPQTTPAAPAPTEHATIADRARGLTRQDGFLPYYWDARKGQLLLEISRFGEEFLYGAGLAGGAGTLEVSLDRGQLGRRSASAASSASGPRVLLVQIQTTHTSGADDPERTRVVAESFPICRPGVDARSSPRTATASSWTRRRSFSRTPRSCRS